MESPMTMTTIHAWPAAESPRVPEPMLALAQQRRSFLKIRRWTFVCASQSEPA
jgi:hypothetical protein